MQSPTIKIDTLKPIGTLVDLTGQFNARVGDAFTPITIQWTEGGNAKNLDGLHPVFEAVVGQGHVENNEVLMNDDAVPVRWVGDQSSIRGYGQTILKLPPQVFSKSGLCYGYLALENDQGVRETSVDIWFKVLGGVYNMGLACNYFITDFQKALAKAKGDVFQALDEIKKNYELKIQSAENAIDDNVVALKNLKDSVGAIQAQIDAGVVATRAELQATDVKADSAEKLSKQNESRIIQLTSTPATDGSTEIVDARIGSSELGSQVYPSLGDAMRNQISDAIALSNGKLFPDVINQTEKYYTTSIQDSCYLSGYTLSAGHKITKIGFASTGLSSEGYFVVINIADTLIYKQKLNGIKKGWNEFTVNYNTEETVYFGIYAPGLYFKATNDITSTNFSHGMNEIVKNDFDLSKVGNQVSIKNTANGSNYEFALQLYVTSSNQPTYQKVLWIDEQMRSNLSTGGPSGADSLYISDYIYPEKTTKLNIKLFTYISGNAKIYFIDTQNKVIDIKEITLHLGWNDLTFGIDYNSEFKLGFYNTRASVWGQAPSTGFRLFEKDGGLIEGSVANKGEIIKTTQTATSPYYFAVQTAYMAEGYQQKDQLDGRLDSVEINVTQHKKMLAKLNDEVATLNTAMAARSSSLVPMQLRLIENNDPFGYVGRWWTETIEGKDYHMTNNDGSEIFFRTSGSETITPVWCKKGITTNVYYAYSIDNGPIHRALTGTAIAIGDQQEHIVRLTVDGVAEGGGEKWSGNYAIGFGGLSEAVQTIGLLPHNPLIHFYGDSITEGIRALGITTTGDMGDTNSATNSYSYLTAKKLTAAPYLVGYGASGIEATGSFNTLINTMGNLYNGKQVDKQEPDLIVVNMGTNDAGTAAQQFSNDYKTAINRLRILYPGVRIACMVPFNQTHADDIASAIAGIPECSLINTEGWAADMEFADGTHPTAKGAEVASDKLAQALINNNLI